MLEFQTLGHRAWQGKENLRTYMDKATNLSLLGLSHCHGPLGWLTEKPVKSQDLLGLEALKYKVQK